MGDFAKPVASRIRISSIGWPESPRPIVQLDHVHPMPLRGACPLGLNQLDDERVAFEPRAPIRATRAPSPLRKKCWRLGRPQRRDAFARTITSPDYRESIKVGQHFRREDR